MKFEWNIGKAALNIKNHGVSFEEAEEAFFDEFSLDLFDESHSTSNEERFQILGMTERDVFVSCLYYEGRGNLQDYLCS